MNDPAESAANVPRPVPGDVTRMLDQVNAGDADALSQLLATIYDELRHMAAGQMNAERRNHTLQPTALVHEAWLRLVGTREIKWQNRAHFYGAAAEVMRRILVDHARARLAAKRGGSRERVPLDDIIDWNAHAPEELIAIDDALNRLADMDAEKARVVSLRFFAGLSVEETAAATGLSDRTVKRHWRFAKAWLQRAIKGDALSEP